MNNLVRKNNIYGNGEFRHYAKHREEGTIREAENIGYINTPDEEFLGKNASEPLDQVYYFNLSRRRLIEIGSLYLCDNLTVCILANNYIRTFDPLIYCNNLQILDLHGNQIVNVPSETFWSTLLKLSIVLLHDNGISTANCITKIATSPSLTILSLYNTPLSLKPSYRHHVVNSIFTLKVLDNYVVSDEEIIEGSTFTGPFATKSQSLYLKTEKIFDHVTSDQEAADEIKLLLSRTNKIMAKYSPILIIQRYVRGYLIRKRLKALTSKNTSSSSLKEIINEHLAMISDGRLPQSKDLGDQLQKDQRQQNDKDARYQNKKSTTTTRIGSTKMGKIKTKKLLKKTRSKKYFGKTTDPHYTLNTGYPISIRQFSPTLSSRDDHIAYPADAGLHYNQDIKNSIETLATDENYPLPPIYSGHSILNSINLNQSEKYSPLKINIDLRELQARAVQFMEDEQSIMDKQFRLNSRELSAIKTGKELLSGLERTMGKNKFNKSDKERYFSPLSDYRMSIPTESRGLVSKNSKFRDLHDDNEENEQLTTHFRLSVTKAATTAVDPTEELILNKQEIAKEMRVARAICKEVLKEKKKPPVIEKDITLNGQQRLYKKLYEAMNLSILRSVDQVHRDWKKSEKAIQKIDTISNRRFVNEVQKERIRQYQRYKVMIAREGGIQDKIISSDALKVIEEEKERENLRVQFARQELNEKTKQRLEELALNTDFNCQATAINRVIQQYDNKRHRNEVREKNTEVVKANQDKVVEKRHMVKKYLEHKRMVQRAVNQVEKKKINGKLLEEANDRIMQAKARVAYLKQRHRVASDYCKVQNTILAAEQLNRNASSMSIAVDDHS